MPIIALYSVASATNIDIKMLEQCLVAERPKNAIYISDRHFASEKEGHDLVSGKKQVSFDYTVV